MADTTTALDVLDGIAQDLGGTGGHDTLVPELQEIRELLGGEGIPNAVDAWLDAHPEATTTVQDGSITGVKIADDTIPDAKLAQTGGILSTVASVTELDTETETTKTKQDVTSESGYYWNGVAQSSASYVYVHLTNLAEGDVINAEYGAIPYQTAGLRFIDAYNGSTRVAAACQNNADPAGSYTVPSGVDNAYVTTFLNTDPVFYVTRTTSTTTLMPKGVPELDETVARISQWVSSDHIVSAFAQSLASGETLTVAERIDNKKNCVHEVWANFETFDTITIAHGEEGKIQSGWVTIDDTNITPYYYDGSRVTQYTAIPHGLTISDFVFAQVVVSNEHPFRARVTVATSDGLFASANDIVFSGSNGDITVKATMDMTNVMARYVVNDMLRDVYIFGDSYVSLTADRYPYQLSVMGYTNFLVSGYGGATAQSEIKSFMNILAVHKPEYVVWALGMNNRDTESGYNSVWKKVLDVVLAECEKYSITPILATIPNVPTVSNVYKNAWVRQSGYRYVDFAKAVGAEEAGSTWYSGMLSSDNVHPTELGAKALAARFLIDVPEVL